MKKGEKSRGEALLQKLITGKKFQQGIRKIRAIFDIPTKGYADMSGISRWYSERSDITKKETRAQQAFKRGVKEFLISQELPMGTWWRHKTIEYIFANGKIEFLWMPPGVEPFVEIINKPNPTREGSFTDLRVYEGASQRDVKDFLARHGRILKPSYRVGTHKQIRKERDPVTSDKAVAIYDLPKKDRQQRVGRNDYKHSTKEVEVGSILNTMGIKITGDAAKARKYRRKNSKR